jgi:hypothetical protein
MRRGLTQEHHEIPDNPIKAGSTNRGPIRDCIYHNRCGLARYEHAHPDVVNGG